MASYQHKIQSSPEAEFPAEKGRYHLYITYSCPFACRALTALYLKGLESTVGLSVAHPVYQETKHNDDQDTHKGWTFVDPTKTTHTGYNGLDYSSAGATSDSVKHATFVRDLYESVSTEPRRYTVPLLWDLKKDTIVNNESADLVRIFNSGFGDLATGKYDLVPSECEAEQNAVNNDIVEPVSEQFYKTTILAKEGTIQEETNKFFDAVGKAEELLAKQRYLLGDAITEADIRLFHQLIRFDVLKRPSNTQSLADFPNIVNYLRDLYQIPAFKKTVNWDHLKLIFVNFDPNAEPAVGPTVDYEATHDRSRFAL